MIILLQCGFTRDIHYHLHLIYNHLPYVDMWNIIYEIWFACLFHCTCNRHHSVISVASSIWSHRSGLALMRASTAQCVASAVVIFLFSCQSSFSLTSCSSDSPFHLCELKTTTSSSTSKRWRRCSSTGVSLSFHVCPTKRAESPRFEDPASGFGPDVLSDSAWTKTRALSSHMFWSSCPEIVLSGTSSSPSTASSSGWLDGIVFTGASISSSGNSSSSGKLAGIDLNGTASFSTNSCKPACLSNGRLACRPISVRGLEDVDKSKKVEVESISMFTKSSTGAHMHPNATPNPGDIGDMTLSHVHLASGWAPSHTASSASSATASRRQASSKLLFSSSSFTSV